MQSGRLNAVPTGNGGAHGMGARDAAAVAAPLAMAAEPATDVKFCAIDDPGCEACQ